MNDRETLKMMRKAIQEIIEFPPEFNPLRGKDGYPHEEIYDETAYKKMVDSYRGGLKRILEEYD